MKSTRKLTIIAVIAVALGMDAAAVLTVPALASRTLRSAPEDLRTAGIATLGSLGQAAKQQLVMLAGDGLIAAAKGTTRLYATLQRLTPEAKTCGGGRVVLIESRRTRSVRTFVIPCREEEAIGEQPAGPVRLNPQIL